MDLDVLIVDDSAAIRRILMRVLRETELPIGQIYEAGDGVQALAELEQRKVGMVLSDINMPNMDGLQLLSRVATMDSMKGIPIVMISTEAAHGKAMEAVSLGAAGYVRRPFTAEQIQETLASLLVAA
jgi:two-component system chemotaxis response regulator CheY